MKLISYPIVAAWYCHPIRLFMLLNRPLKRRLPALLQLLLFILSLPTTAQIACNLPVMLDKKQLITIPANDIQVLKDRTPPGVSTKGIVWLKGVNFKQGTIEVSIFGAKMCFFKAFWALLFTGWIH